jgi:hypothetical protein
MAMCAFDSCTRDKAKRDWCEAHYRQWQRGETLKPLRWDVNAPKVCAVCGVQDWPANGMRTTCSPRCAGRYYNHDKVAPDRERPCTGCGMLVDLTVRSARSGRIKRSDTAMCDLCRNARFTRHKVSVAFLAARDGDDCKICGDRVDMTLRKPSVWGPSVDHITPWSKGGTHDLANLQLAHLWCNQAKSAKYAFTLKVGG